MVAPVIWFVFGLSGAGKSWLGANVAAERGWSHFEIDQWQAGISDGLDLFGFRGGWTTFEESGNPEALLGQITSAFGRAGKVGAVLTFPSSRVVSERQMYALSRSALAFYLVGEARHCIEAFLGREAATSRGLDQAHWQHHNSVVLNAVSQPELKQYRVEAFDSNGKRRTLEEIHASATALENRRAG